MLKSVSQIGYKRRMRGSQGDTSELRCTSKPKARRAGGPPDKRRRRPGISVRGVVDGEEAEKAAAEHAGRADHKRVAHDRGDDGEADRGAKAGNAGEAVQAIDDVHRLRHARYGKNGEDEGKDRELEQLVQDRDLELRDPRVQQEIRAAAEAVSA